MLISVTAPKKGLGQSVTTIGLAGQIGIKSRRKVLIIDLNDYAADIETYLNPSLGTKGLDEFKNRYDNDMLGNRRSFLKCVQTVHPLLDMMSGSQCFQLDHTGHQRLFQEASKHYEYILVDTVAGNHPATRKICNEADRVLVVLNQEAKIFELIKSHGLYQADQSKLWFAVNRWQNQINRKRVSYGLKEMKAALKRTGFQHRPVHVLPMDGELLNECNQQTLLHYCFNQGHAAQGYFVQMERLVDTMLPQIASPQADSKAKSSGRLKNLFIHLLHD